MSTNRPPEKQEIPEVQIANNTFNLGIDSFSDANFPKLTIKQFAAKQLNISEENVIDTLYQALPSDKQNEKNKELIETAVKRTVNASGAVILMINTNDGPQLIYGNSQRRKKVISSNGACEANESMEDTTARELIEELGNPGANGIIRTIVKQPTNCRSVRVTNQIGKTAEEMAKRIIEVDGENSKLYINMSALYVNQSPVNINRLNDEIKNLNIKLQKSAPYYNPAVSLIFVKGKEIEPADLSTVNKEKACVIINDFKRNCQDVITTNFSSVFSKNYNENSDAKDIKEALLAIIDLTENNELGLVPKPELTRLLTLDLNQKDVKEEFRKDYFPPSFMNLKEHVGTRTVNQFFADIETLVPSPSSKGVMAPAAASSTSSSAIPVPVQPTEERTVTPGSP